MQYKTIRVFYGQVIAEVCGYRVYQHFYDTEALAGRLAEATGHERDSLVAIYPEFIVLIKSLVFTWRADVPEQYKTLETWWNKVMANESEEDAFLYFVANVPTQLMLELRREIEKALTPWVPVETRPEAQLTEKELADPEL